MEKRRVSAYVEIAVFYVSIYKKTLLPRRNIKMGTKRCYYCGGSGRINGNDICSVCAGSGYTSDNSLLTAMTMTTNRLKKRFITAAIFLILAGVNCYAQNQDPRVKAIQGEWQLLTAKEGNETIDLRKLGIEQVWKFDGYFFSQLGKKDGTIEVLNGTFQVISNVLILNFPDEEPAVFTYAIQGNILNVTTSEDSLTFRKQ
jgi:hypothetical protein